MLKRLLLILVAVASVATAAQAKDRDRGNDSLNLSYSSTGYLQIELTGPRAIVDRAKAGKAPAGGCGYTLSWGDQTASTPDPATCALDLRHTYAKPGRYEIEAYVTDPTDPNAVNGQLHGKIVVILN